MVRVTPSPASFLQLQKKTTLFKIDSQTVNAGQKVTFFTVSGAGEIDDLTVYVAGVSGANPLSYWIHLVIDGTDCYVPIKWINDLTQGAGSFAFKVNKYDTTNQIYSVSISKVSFSKSLVVQFEASGTWGATVSMYMLTSQPAGG
jgi:hypothetical protein